jgi:hypothetical protein
VHTTVLELLTEEVRQTVCGAGESPGAGGEDDVVETHG